MRYYKIIENGYIKAVGTGGGGTEIIQSEYENLLSVIVNKPPRTDTTDYRLTEGLEWEAYEVDPPDPDPEIDAAEAFALIFGGDPE